MGTTDEKGNQGWMDSDDDFDYLKEIEEIEAQERELAEQRRRKKEELEKRRAEREQMEQKAAAKDSASQKNVSQKNASQKNSTSQKTATQKKREIKEQKKEAEWLGDSYDNVKTVSVPKKKKSKVGLVIGVIVVLMIIAAGAAYAWKMQMDKKAVGDFEQKVASFRAEKLDGTDFGAHQDYFDDFMKQCQEAVDSKDLKKIESLEQKWAELEDTFTKVSNGKTSLDAFLTSADAALAKYFVTSDYKKEYDALMEDIENAKKNCGYDQVAALQKRVDAMATNLKSSNMKELQNLKNDISSIDLDPDYLTDDQKKQIEKFDADVEKAIADEKYAEAASTLKTWKANASVILEVIEEQKAEEAAKAESEAEERRKAEEKRKAEEESKKAAAAETKKPETSKPSNNNSGSNSSSGTAAKGDYILPSSSSKYLTASDVKNLSSYQLMLARNEIYARHGRKFKDSELQKYFNSKSWYKGTIAPEDFSVSVFNDYEIKNIDLIRSYE